MAVGRDLRELHAATGQHVELPRWLPLPKERASGSRPHEAGVGCGRLERGAIQPAKERDRREQAHVRCHMSIIAGADLCRAGVALAQRYASRPRVV